MILVDITVGFIWVRAGEGVGVGTGDPTYLIKLHFSNSNLGAFLAAHFKRPPSLIASVRLKPNTSRLPPGLQKITP